MDAFDHCYRIEARTDHALVWQYGQLNDLKTLFDFRKAVEASLHAHGLRRVVFDARETMVDNDAVKDDLWAWVSDPRRFESVALVLPNAGSVAEANAEAGGGGHMRAFSSAAEALAWLRGRN